MLRKKEGKHGRGSKGKEENLKFQTEGKMLIFQENVPLP